MIQDLAGQRRIVLARWSVLQGSEKSLSRVLLSFVDVTERRRAEQALAASNRQWQLTFDAIPDLIMVVDTHHRIVRANRAMAATLGMTERDLIGKLCFELVHRAPCLLSALSAPCRWNRTFSGSCGTSSRGNA